MGTAMTATTVASRLEACGSDVRNGFYFTQPDNAVMFDEVLSQTAKVVYCNLLSHVKKGTNRCKLYISTIAEEVKKSVRTVRRALSQLCERGVIVRLMQYGNKQNQLASLFVIIGKNAACYQSGNHQSVAEQHHQVEVNTGKAVTVKRATAQGLSSWTKMASPCEIKTAAKVKTGVEIRTETAAKTAAWTKTASLPKVSAPHAKNGRQNNDKGDNESMLKNTLIGQAELPKSSSSSSFSSSSSSSHQQKSQLPCERTCKRLQNGDIAAQILIDFDAQEERETHETHELQKIREHQEISEQRELLTGLPVVECPNESDENKAD